MKGMLNKKTLTLVFLLLLLPLLVGCFPPKNQAPILTSTPITLAEVDELYTYNVDATDPDGDALTYSLDVKPSGMTIDSATGLIEWTPAAEGDYDVVVKVSDETLDITQSFTIVVIEEEGPGWTPTPPAPPTKTYTIVATAGPGGSISPSGDVTVNKGANQSFTMALAANYHIADVLVDGASVGAVPTYDFTNVTADHTIHVTFAIDTYTITATAGSGGSISPSGAVVVNHGANRSFTITPDSVFYGVQDVLVDGINSMGPVSSYTFTSVTGNHTILASFILLGRVYNETKGTHHDIIQEAINEAGNPGDTIHVMAGVYPENVVIPFTKAGLQLIGAGSGVTSIAPVSGKAVALGGNLGIIDGIRVQGFTLETSNAYAFIALSGTNNGTYYTTNLILEDIVVDGGIYGIGLNAVNGVTFTDVHVSNVSIMGQGGIEMTGVFDFTFIDGSLEGNYFGIRLQGTDTGEVGQGYGVNGNIHIHDSVLTGNVTAIENQYSTQQTIIDATNNWWGDSSGPYNATTNPDGLGNAVSNFVNYGTF